MRRVFTSNLAARADPDCLLVDYDRYLNSDPMVADNAGLMLLKLLARCGARQAVLAGFDGFWAGAITAGRPPWPSTTPTPWSASAALGSSFPCCPWSSPS